MDSDDVRIGERLQALRGPVISQAGLANAMKDRGHEKWSQATVWSVEQGKRPLRLSEAASLASILHAEVEDLLVSREAGDALVGVRESLFHLKEQEERLSAAIDDYELSRLAVLLDVENSYRDHVDALSEADLQRVKLLYDEARDRAKLTSEDLIARVKPAIVREAREHGIDL